jgi:hypothetical protein
MVVSSVDFLLPTYKEPAFCGLLVDRQKKSKNRPYLCINNLLIWHSPLFLPIYVFSGPTSSRMGYPVETRYQLS